MTASSSKKLFALLWLFFTLPLAAGDLTYSYKKASPGGTGKVIFGREIAETMSHRGAAWLDRPEREAEEDTKLLVRSLGLKPTDHVADIGAGSGHLTFMISPLVGKGQVFAVDIQKEMLALIKQKAAQYKTSNVRLVPGSTTSPNLKPASIDLALVVDAYHEFSHPVEMMQALRQALKPHGRLVLVEYRGEDKKLPIKPLHKMTEEQVKKEMTALGFLWQKTVSRLPRQHVLFFAVAPAGK